MVQVLFQLDDVVQLKKPHACGSNQWRVIRMGMDIRVKCEACGHSVLIPRPRFERLVRKVLKPGSSVTTGLHNSPPDS